MRWDIEEESLSQILRAGSGANRGFFRQLSAIDFNGLEGGELAEAFVKALYAPESWILASGSRLQACEFSAPSGSVPETIAINPLLSDPGTLVPANSHQSLRAMVRFPFLDESEALGFWSVFSFATLQALVSDGFDVFAMVKRDAVFESHGHRLLSRLGAEIGPPQAMLPLPGARCETGRIELLFLDPDGQT